MLRNLSYGKNPRPLPGPLLACCPAKLCIRIPHTGSTRGPLQVHSGSTPLCLWSSLVGGAGMLGRSPEWFSTWAALGVPLAELFQDLQHLQGGAGPEDQIRALAYVASWPCPRPSSSGSPFLVQVIPVWLLIWCLLWLWGSSWGPQQCWEHWERRQHPQRWEWPEHREQRRPPGNTAQWQSP